jgi:hypothetical protein
MDPAADGNPVATLTMAVDGGLYGAGYTMDGGVIFRLVKDALPSSIDVMSATGNTGGTTSLVARLTSAGSPVQNAVISFTVNGVAVGSATTDINGFATKTNVSLVGIAPGTYATGIGASFAGNSGVLPSTATGVLTVTDLAPPVLKLPANMTVNATGPTGAIVTYTVTATNATVSCTPASGSMFPIGITTVKCTATSTTGQTSTGSFTIKVLGAAEQLVALVEKLRGMPLSSQVRNHLISFLQTELAKPKKVRLICAVLEAFKLIVKLKAGSSGAAIITDINRIQAVLGCGLAARMDDDWKGWGKK